MTQEITIGSFVEIITDYDPGNTTTIPEGITGTVVDVDVDGWDLIAIEVHDFDVVIEVPAEVVAAL